MLALVVLFLWQSDAIAVSLARNTMWLCSAVCAFSLPFGLFLAITMFRTDLPFRRCLAVLLIAQLFLPLYLQMAGWDAAFGKLGWQTMSYGSTARPLLSGWAAAIWIHAAAAVPWFVVIIGLGLRDVAPELEEAAMLNGTWIQVFARVTLPRALAATVVAVLWICVMTAGDMTVTNVFQVRTFAEELYTGFALGNDFNASVLGIRPGALMIAGMLLTSLTAIRWLTPEPSNDSPRRARKFALGHWRWPVFGVVVVIVMGLFGVPIVSLINKAGIVVQSAGDERLRSWTWMQFGTILFQAPARYGEYFLWTLVTAGISSALAVVAGAMLAWWATRRRLGGACAFLTASVCFAMPGPLVGMALIGLLNHPHEVTIFLYDKTVVAPVLAMTVKALPLAILVCWQGYRIISTESLAAATLDGAGVVRRFFSFGIVRCWPVVLVAALVTSAVSAADLAANILVMPPGVTTVAVRIFELVHAGVDNQVASICLWVVAMYFVVATAILWAARLLLRRD